MVERELIETVLNGLLHITNFTFVKGFLIYNKNGDIFFLYLHK